MKEFSISPWKLAHAWSNAGYIRTIKDAQGEHIAHVCDLEDGLPEATANARLMAAAPELLSALIEYVERHEQSCEPTGLPEYEKARAAIAKATARSDA